MLERLCEVEKRFDAIEADLLDPQIMSDIEKYTSLLKERANLEPVVENDAKGVAPFILCYTEILRKKGS